MIREPDASSEVRLDGLRVLVTGAGSFVGEELIRRLSAAGALVVAIYRRPSRGIQRLNSLSDLELVQGDLNDPRTLAGIARTVDAVVHVAATGPDSAVRADVMFNGNLAATEMVLDAAIEARVRSFIYLSSVSVHGMPLDPVLSADTGINRPSMYGLSKRAAEILLESRSDALSCVALRLPAVLGLGARTHWLSGVVRSAIQGDDIVARNPMGMFNNGIYLSDLAEFVVQLLTLQLAPFQAFPIASSQPISVANIVRCVLEETGSVSRARFTEPRSSSFTIDDTLARDCFGYRSMSIENAVRRYARREAECDSNRLVFSSG